jgi:hypothetical protein
MSDEMSGVDERELGKGGRMGAVNSLGRGNDGSENSQAAGD